MNTYSCLGSNKIRVAVFFETAQLIRERINDTLIWSYFVDIERKFKEILYVEAITAKQIKEDILTKKNFDVIILPGGDAEDHASYLGRKGREKINEFVRDYGREPSDDPAVPELVRKGVLDYDTKYWHYGLIPEITSKDLSHWNRGSGYVSISFTRPGMLKMNTKTETKVHYANGALMTNSKKFNRGQGQSTKMRVLANYTSEVCHIFGERGTMVNTPAIVSNEIGKANGRVVVSSAHLEKYPESDDAKLLINLIIWASKQEFPLFS